MSAGTSLIASFYQAEARLKIIARQGMAIELGGVVFLFIGGILAAISWRLPYGLYLFSWLLLALVVVCVPRPARQKSQKRGRGPQQTATACYIQHCWRRSVR